MNINLGKTKVMIVSRAEEECKPRIDGADVEDVKKLKYLGATISGDGMCDQEIERVGAAAKVVGAMRKEVLESLELQRRTKMRCSMQWWCPPSSMGVRHGLCKGGTRARYRHVRETMFLKGRKVWQC